MARADESGSTRLPAGIPPAESSARRRVTDEDEEDEDAPKAKVRSLRPPARGAGEKKSPNDEAADGHKTSDATPEPAVVGPKKPVGLKNMTTSARLRLELALDHDDDDDDTPAKKRPVGLKNMTTSARLRLELALDHDDDDEGIPPPNLGARASLPAIRAGVIPLDEQGIKALRSLYRWIGFCGLITLAIGALTGLSYLTGTGSVAHVVVGMLASAISIWLLLASINLRRAHRNRQRQHHLVNAFGLLRSALLLKAILLFSGMVLGCFAFSVATSLLLLL